MAETVAANTIEPDLIRAWSPFALALRPPTGRVTMGEKLSRSAGHSVEFQDFREFHLGDDLRHLDWRAYARTDRLMVKVYRQETAPTVTLLIDFSASMQSSPAKLAWTRALARSFWDAARQAGATVSMFSSGDIRQGWQPIDGPEHLAKLEPQREPDLARWYRHPAMGRRRALVLLISDLLMEAEPRGLCAALARQADTLSIVQPLASFEEEPPIGMAVRLIDAETHEAADLVLDAATVDGYRKRLLKLRQDYSDEVRRRGGWLLRVSESHSVAELTRACISRGILLPA